VSVINHVVLLDVPDAVNSQIVDDALAAIRDLPGRIDGVLAVTAGPDVSIQGLAAGYTHGAIVRLSDPVARQRFLRHPAHVEAVAPLRPLLRRITIVDLGADTPESEENKTHGDR